MRVHEIGIVKEGIPLLSQKYSKSGDKNFDSLSKSALISSLLQYAESVMSPVEYFESNKYSMIFKKGKMKTPHTSKPSKIFSYVILDRRKEISEKNKKRIIDLCTNILDEFIKRYDGMDTSEVSKFEKFKPFIDDTLGDLTKSLDDKFSSLFF
ncbi:MAG: hypothetical protein EU541_08025 [Promethearchaeota archaeon]|nr:MAG: hypothetical protein EU541_08025 [Candidatus Lokiarchaeota archaeon]